MKQNSRSCRLEIGVQTKSSGLPTRLIGGGDALGLTLELKKPPRDGAKPKAGKSTKCGLQDVSDASKIIRYSEWELTRRAGIPTTRR